MTGELCPWWLMLCKLLSCNRAPVVLGWSTPLTVTSTILLLSARDLTLHHPHAESQRISLLLILRYQMSLLFCVSKHFLFSFWSENFFRPTEQKFCGYWVRLTRNSRICNARSAKDGSSHCYLDRRSLHEMDKIVDEYDRKQFHRLVKLKTIWK